LVHGRAQRELAAECASAPLGVGQLAVPVFARGFALGRKNQDAVLDPDIDVLLLGSREVCSDDVAQVLFFDVDGWRERLRTDVSPSHQRNRSSWVSIGSTWHFAPVSPTMRSEPWAVRLSATAHHFSDRCGSETA